MFCSYDEHPELFSLLAQKGTNPGGQQSLRQLVQEAHTFIIRYFAMLPRVDYTIANFYYVQGLSQDQISELLKVTQAAVSRRLKFITHRLRFLLKMPSTNPIQVREDFEFLFPEELFEFAYYFYWEHAQNRVKYFIKTSQSGAANKFQRVMSYLEALADQAQVAETTGQELPEDQVRRTYLALVYLEYFRYTRTKSNVITYLYKKHDDLRVEAHEVGDSIF